MDAYRIEHIKYGFGPYCLDPAPEHRWDCTLELCQDCEEIRELEGFSEFLCEDAGKRHPEPVQDGLGWNYGGRIFGFESLDSLEDWFGIYSDDLRDHGFAVFLYRDVTDYLEGLRQIAFRPTSPRVAV